MQGLYAARFGGSRLMLKSCIDTTLKIDELCTNPDLIYCCKRKGDKDPRHEDFYMMEECRHGQVLMNARRRHNDKVRKDHRAQRAAKVAQMKTQPPKHSYTSEELECPEVWQGTRGKVFSRTHKVCCELPWTRDSKPRKCKPCPYMHRSSETRKCC